MTEDKHLQKFNELCDERDAIIAKLKVQPTDELELAYNNISGEIEKMFQGKMMSLTYGVSPWIN